VTASRVLAAPLDMDTLFETLAADEVDQSPAEADIRHQPVP
jgi:hypothetical protein